MYGLSLGVNLIMSLEVPKPLESLATVLAFVWPLSSMYSGVALKDTVISEALATALALVQLLPTMHSSVKSKVPTCAETLPTVFALEQLVPGVD